MPKDIKRKPYTPPLVFDLNGPNLSLVGTSWIFCSEGAVAASSCCAGTGGATDECDGGTRVYAYCSNGQTPTPGTSDKNCGKGSSAWGTCCNGDADATCNDGSLAAGNCGNGTDPGTEVCRTGTGASAICNTGGTYSVP